MPQRVYTADGRSFVATDRYGRADQRRCQQYLDPGACHSSGCQTSGQRCHSATTPIVNPTPMMAQCATISPTSHRAGWAAACRAAGCRVDRGMACVPRLRLTPKSSSRRRLPQARGTHATNTPRVFIRGKGEALLLKIDQNINTGAQRYTVRYAAEPQETVVIDQSQIRRLKWGLYGRLKLRPFPRVMGEEPCSYYGRRLLYDQSHSSEEVQRCLARLCAREDADNAFCAYGEGRGRVIPPGGVDAVVRGIGRVLAKFCEESPAALESEICQVYRQLTRACSEDDESTVFAPADRCHKRAKDKTKDLDKDLAAVDLPKLFGQEKEEVGAYLEARNTTAKTRDAAPDVSVVRDRTACRKACAATKARATCGGKAEAACRAWSECDWNTGEDACYGKAELACYRGCADVAAKAAAAHISSREPFNPNSNSNSLAWRFHSSLVSHFFLEATHPQRACSRQSLASVQSHVSLHACSLFFSSTWRSLASAIWLSSSRSFLSLVTVLEVVTRFLVPLLAHASPKYPRPTCHSHAS